ncbi:MAG: dephospho-CoA kinase [Gammaproteobacteria bacterium]|jgi:dephospho-CoA kinase|nr:dephospho-CoA kinase [Gammaproteobacteria bacterium]
MFIIGLTGGIGSGKTTVANYFAELGITIIDADQVAREVVEPGTAAFQQIIAKFGQVILTADGQLNRSKLREFIFADANLRQWLENLVHPQIRSRMRELSKQATSPYCILVIPLLLENKPNELVQRILVVDSPEALQVSRTQARDHLTAGQVISIMVTQMTRSQRLAAADDIIVNDGNLASLKQQVIKMHQKYLSMT